VAALCLEAGPSGNAAADQGLSCAVPDDAHLAASVAVL
jgi:hypothetical protein